MSFKRIRLPDSKFAYDERNEVIVNHAKIDRHVCVFNRCRGKYESLFLFIFTRFVRHPWPLRLAPSFAATTRNAVRMGKELQDLVWQIFAR